MRQFDATLIFTNIPSLIPYLWITLGMTLLSGFFGTVLGALIAAGKLGRHRLTRGIANGYTTLLRCTPSVVLLFIVYYGLPKLSLELFHRDIDDIAKGIFVAVTLSLLFAATMSEIIRSAWQAIPTGQWEAAECAGMDRISTFRRIIFPQLFLIALPNVGNAVIGLLKEGALAFTIGFIDLIGKANLMVSMSLGTHSREIYLSAALLYWIIIFLLERLLQLAEHALNKNRRAARTAAPRPQKQGD